MKFPLSFLIEVLRVLLSLLAISAKDILDFKQSILAVHQFSLLLSPSTIIIKKYIYFINILFMINVNLPISGRVKLAA